MYPDSFSVHFPLCVCVFVDDLSLEMPSLRRHMEIFDTLTISDFFFTRQQHPVPAVCVCKRKRAKFLFCPYILPQSHTTTVKLAMYPPSVGVKMNEGNNLLAVNVYIYYIQGCACEVKVVWHIVMLQMVSPIHKKITVLVAYSPSNMHSFPPVQCVQSFPPCSSRLDIEE